MFYLRNCFKPGKVFSLKSLNCYHLLLINLRPWELNNVLGACKGANFLQVMIFVTWKSSYRNMLLFYKNIVISLFNLSKNHFAWYIVFLKYLLKVISKNSLQAYIEQGFAPIIRTKFKEKTKIYTNTLKGIRREVISWPQQWKEKIVIYFLFCMQLTKKVACLRIHGLVHKKTNKNC